jgi:hypothetical protein
MGRGEFEEILEECLSALLEGRRTIEESLSLYPAWRGRLEPLLRAAEETAAAFNQDPPPYVKERGLQRFLDAARVRRRLRRLIPGPTATPWWRWAPTGLGAAAVVAVLAFVSATILAGDGRGLDGQVSVRPFTPTEDVDSGAAPSQSPLERVQTQVAALETSLRQGEPVNVALLVELEEANMQLAADLGGPGEIGLIERLAVASVATRQFELLQELQDRSSPTQAQAVEESLAAAAEVLAAVGATPQPKAEPTPSPEASPSPTAPPSPAPSPTPGPQATPTPTPQP